MPIKKIAIFLFCVFNFTLYSQSEKQKTFTKKVLFILDGSGSMKERWQGESKWDIAIQTLSNLIDSFESSNAEFEVGVRILGHQYPRTQNRCDDTKLEIPFSKNLNFESVYSTLSQLSPQGHTPIALALSESEKDFKEDKLSQNTIILITDGLENCDGTPCEVAQKLKAKNIFINPYIIGLGIDSLQSLSLECIGQYIDAKDKVVFQKVIKTILDEVSIRTTLDVSFLRSDSTPFPTYIPYSILAKRQNKELYNFIYTATSSKRMDTININPQYQYILQIHTFPKITIDTLNITIGQHNKWTIPLSTGSSEIHYPNSQTKYKYLIRKNGFNNLFPITNYQPFDIQIDSSVVVDKFVYPNSQSDTLNIIESKESQIHYRPTGILDLKITPNAQVSIFDAQWNTIKKVTLEYINTIQLDIGDYFVLFKRENEPCDNTKMYSITIKENQKIQLILE